MIRWAAGAEQPDSSAKARHAAVRAGGHVVVAIVIHCCISAPGSGQVRQEDTGPAFLARTFGLSDRDLRAIDAGRVFARTLPADDKREVASVGIVRLRVTPEFYVKRFADITNFKKAEAVLQIGTFGDPPHPDEVRALTLDVADLRNLQRCRVADCGVQLPAESIAEFSRRLNWRAPGAERDANELMRESLVAYVGRYQRSGAAGMVTYADSATPLDTAAEFRDLVKSDRRVLPRFPGLRRHLLEYPTSSGGTNRIYWSKEKVGRKTVVTVTHLAIHGPLSASPAEYVAASKQIYASHYFDTSLGLTILVRDRTQPSPAIYLAYVNRSRVDVFTGALAGVKRTIVRSRARASVSEHLGELKTSLEREFAASGAT